MSRNHLDAYNKFVDFLDARRAEPPDDRDIRAHVLSLRDREIGLGYVSAALSGGYGTNLARLFPRALPLGAPGWAECDTYLMLGTIYRDADRSHAGGTRLFHHWDGRPEILLFEQGFLASASSWSHSFRERDPRAACLGYVYDDIAHYFMADYPNRLIQKLNSTDVPAPSDLARARALIHRIVARRISKYNAQPLRLPDIGNGGGRRVLVCDQAYADASTIYGRIDRAGFEAMLLAAIRENPDAEILVKTHPDTTWEKGKRPGYFSHLSNSGRVRVLRDPVNPYALFDLVDTVYVGTSQIGLEALFAGKRVICFGAPFYAGWGLTDDRAVVPHRQRRRSLDDLFHYVFVWYTIYHVPGAPLPSEIEAVIDYIEDTRPVQLPPDDGAHAVPPVVSVVMPVFNVEDVLEASIGSVQRQNLAEIEIIPVVDAATDGSLAIIERLARQDRRIRPIVLEQNVGQGMARNRGLAAARGAFVFFLDSDDLLADPGVLSEAVAAARESDAEMVRVQKLSFTDGEDPHLARPDPVERQFTEDRQQPDLAADTRILESWHVWQFLYATDLLRRQEIRFLTPRWEERPFVAKALRHAKGIRCLPRPGIRYRKRAGSTTGQARGPADLDMLITAIDGVGTEFGACLEGRILAAQFGRFFLGSSAWAGCLTTALASDAGASVVLHLKTAFGHFRLDKSDWQGAISRFSGLAETVPALALFFAALANDRRDLLLSAIKGQPLPLAEVHHLFRTQPEGGDAAWLRSAVNLYARNDRVVFAPAHHSGTAAAPPKVLIHIGASKTGSTFLQHYFERNRPALLRQGIWYPQKGLLLQPGRPHKQAGHALLLAAAKKGDRRTRRFLRGVAKSEGPAIHTILLSSEAFFLDPKGPKLVDLFPGMDCRALVYLRRQDAWANSQYHELVAGGAIGRVTQDIQTWLDAQNTRRLLDYRNILNAWADRIGRDNMIVRPYAPACWPRGDLVADFAQSTGLDGLAGHPQPQEDLVRGAVLSAAHGARLRDINARPFPTRQAYLAFVQDVTDQLSLWRANRGIAMPAPDYLDHEARAKLMEELAGCNTDIVEHWMPDGAKALLSPPSKAPPQSTDLHTEEIEIIEATYARHAASPGKTPPDAADASVAYGLLGWRRWLLAPLVRPFVVARGTADDVSRFDADPAGFFHGLETPAYRVWANRLYPRT